MNLADAFPFYPMLGQSRIAGPVDHTRTGPTATDTIVTDEWRIVVEPGDEADRDTMDIAAADLQNLLQEAFATRVQIASPGGDAGRGTIRLRSAPPAAEVGQPGPCEGGRPHKRRTVVRLAVAPTESAPVRGQSRASGPEAGQSSEAYRLTVAADSITVESSSGVGVLQGAFYLGELMRERSGPYVERGTWARAPLFARRIHRSAVSPFYVEEAAGYTGSPYHLRTLYGYDIVNPARHEYGGVDAYYADHVLLGLARHGFNGIWLRGVLRLLSHTGLYPDGGAYADEALPVLRGLCRRTARYGIGVYLYLNEPMGFPADDPFWEAHPGLRGSRTGLDNFHCLCTSRPETLAFCEEGMYDLFSSVPELAGAIVITASEFPTHCWSHLPSLPPAERAAHVADGTLCPRCADRDPRAVVPEVIAHLDRGLKRANPAAQLIAWNWAWQRYEPLPQPTILAGLPDDVIVLADWERGVPTQALGQPYENREYSLKIIGPADGCRAILAHQRARGVDTYAKVQIGTTHENPSVPYLPVVTAIGEKYRSLAAHGVAGMMTCWNFGNMPSIATEAANAFTWGPQPDEADELLTRVACRYVGAQAAPVLVGAWRHMHEAMEQAFPGTIPFLYTNPLSRGPAFPWTLEPLGRRFPPGWLVVPDARADDPTAWLDIFGAETISRCMATLTERWEAAARSLEAALPLTAGSGTAELRREIGLVRTCILQFRGVANVLAFLAARRRLGEAAPGPDREQARAELVDIIRREHRDALEALPLVDADCRLGFHGEAYAYLFDRPLIEARVAALDGMLAQLGRTAAGGDR
ncbi:MAG: hypothetical protein ACYC5O_20385 [Anaerolineae bacterium]